MFEFNWNRVCDWARRAAIAVLWLAPASIAPAQTNSMTGSSVDAPLNPNPNATTSGAAGAAAQNPYLDVQSAQPVKVSDPSTSILTLPQLLAAQTSAKGEPNKLQVPPAPGEFETYIQNLLGHPVPRFGSKLVLPADRDFAAPATATVPPDYVVQPGDKIVIALSGSLQGSVDSTVDNDGRI